jgi:protein-tyrosine-phosphatase
MNAELSGRVEQRAAKHAALGDPSRLRIVDLLTWGDLSPTEIRLALGIPSNLVAHHLNALEAAGMVTRSPSEADRRRNYVRLTDTALEGLDPRRHERAERVVFVCTANSARSQLAAALWATRSSIPAASAGTHPAARIDPGAVAAAVRHDLRMTGGRPRLLDDVLRDNDIIVAVCDNAHEELGATTHLHWSIPDPVPVGTDEVFDSAYAELERRVGGLATLLAAG